MQVLLVGLLIAVLDQVTKYFVRILFSVGESRPVIDHFFDLTYVRNTGAAWGILGGQNTYLMILSVVMLVVMLVFRRSFLSDTWEHRLALGFMVGGIVGNLMWAYLAVHPVLGVLHEIAGHRTLSRMFRFGA